MKEIRTRVRRITQDLNALLEELAAVREPNAGELLEQALTPEILKGFKASVDCMQRLLWAYIEAASYQPSRKNATTQQSLAINGLVDALRSLPGTEPSSSRGAASGSFIEKVEAIVERKIPPRPHD
jgi:hypothetical protein